MPVIHGCNGCHFHRCPVSFRATRAIQKCVFGIDANEEQRFEPQWPGWHWAKIKSGECKINSVAVCHWRAALSPVCYRRPLFSLGCEKCSLQNAIVTYIALHILSVHVQICVFECWHRMAIQSAASTNRLRNRRLSTTLQIYVCVIENQTRTCYISIYQQHTALRLSAAWYVTPSTIFVHIHRPHMFRLAVRLYVHMHACTVHTGTLPCVVWSRAVPGFVTFIKAGSVAPWMPSSISPLCCVCMFVCSSTASVDTDVRIIITVAAAAISLMHFACTHTHTQGHHHHHRSPSFIIKMFVRRQIAYQLDGRTDRNGGTNNQSVMSAN